MSTAESKPRVEIDLGVIVMCIEWIWVEVQEQGYSSALCSPGYYQQIGTKCNSILVRWLGYLSHGCPMVFML